MMPANNPVDPVSGDRSPYAASLAGLVARFGHTQSRRLLLAGLLDFRAELHKAGLSQGFQWIDGSFLENIEQSPEGRPPDDIDVVTFFYIPDGHTVNTLANEFASLFDGDNVKETYSVDAYFAQLDEVTSEEIIREATYWYSLWSHTRDGRWKGYLQVSLSGEGDDDARAQLELMEQEGG